MAGTLSISLALSGGAARGAFHLGVLAAMERQGVTIGAISGTSIGAVIAVGIGSGVSAFDLLRLFKSKAFRRAFKFNYFRKGLLRIDEKASILREIAPIERLEAMKIPTFVTCVDLHQGKIVRFHEGDSIKLAMASSALIPLFRPVAYQDYLLIDGGFMDNLPVEPLLDFPYPLWSINLFPPQNAVKKRSFTWMERALFLSMMASSKHQRDQSDVCINDGAVNEFGMFTFREITHCFEAGYRVGSETILTFLDQQSII